MSLLHTFVLGIVEGITEFLPVSSTGHLILTTKLLGLNETDFLTSFEIFIQLGAIMAVATIYTRKLLTNFTLWFKLLTAFIPTAFIGLLAYDFIKSTLLNNYTVTLWALAIGGAVFILLEKLINTAQQPTGQPTYRQALAIGLMQSLSMVPGVSRAAATIFGGMVVGLPKRSAVEFSFLLALPTMAAATGLDLWKSNLNFSSEQWTTLIMGFMMAFLTALVTVKLFIRYIQHHSFIPFGIYRIILAMLFWLIYIR